MGLKPAITTPFNDARQAAINGIDSAQSEAHGWDVEKANIPVTALVRTSDTVATLTIPSLPNYDITAQEVITWTLPASILTSGAQIVATPTFTIDLVAGGSAIKSINGLLKASIKTINGLAIASVKTRNGLA